MSTDSHGPGPQGSAGGADGVDAETPLPVRAGARRRSSAEPGGRRKAPPRRKRKARRVHRVVHHVDTWSLAKVAAVFVICTYAVGLVSGYLLWRAADRVGTIDGIEGFMEDTGGYDTFVLKGGVVFSSAVVIGVILGILTICLVVLAGILFNLISDLTGGIRMTVIDEDLIVTPARRGRPAPPLGDPGPDSSAETASRPPPPVQQTVAAEAPPPQTSSEPTRTEVAASSPGPTPGVEIDFG